jgi:fructosamine-3-kinase
MFFPADLIARLTGRAITRASPLTGGSIAAVYRVELADGRILVAKTSPVPAQFDLEARMLRYLRQHSTLPVPDVLHSQPDLLLMTFLPGDSTMTAGVQQHAAELLAGLHSITAPQFGLDFDTLIGGLHQPNPHTDAWIPFFREHRLLYMAQAAYHAGELPAGLLRRIEAFAPRLDALLEEPPQPALIHGDMWTTNILGENGRVTSLIDPAIYYAHPEIELAFSTLFGTFGDAFFRRYQELSPIAPGFFEQRRDIYNLYPLLVHVRLFGGGYVGSVERILRKFGV